MTDRTPVMMVDAADAARLGIPEVPDAIAYHLYGAAPPPRMLTRQEAAAVLGVPPNAVTTYAAAGLLPGATRTPGGEVRQGGYRYPEPAVRRLAQCLRAGLTHSAIRILMG